MKYVNRKDETIVANLESVNEKYGTVTLVYETGEKAGKAFDINQSTLKRWWRAENETKTVEEILNLDMEQINTPYPEPKKQKYIPKPESVIEYEKKKRGARERNTQVPEYEKIADILVENGVVLKRINAGYISLIDATKIKRFASGIGVLASTVVAEQFVKRGLTSRPCIENGTPFRFDIKTGEEFEKMVDAFKCVEVK